MPPAIPRVIRHAARPLWRRVAPAHRAKLRAWLAAPAYPPQLQIEHTTRCNLKCVMCPHSFDPPPKHPDFPLDTFERLLDEMPGVEHVLLQGLGEAMLHKQLMRIIRAAKDRGIGTSFISNMTILTDGMAEELVALGHDLVVASVDAADPEVLNNIRRGAKYDVYARVMQNLARLQAAKERAGADRPRVYVNSVLMRHTAKDAPRLVRMLRDLGVARVTFLELYASAIPPEEVLPNGNRFRDEWVGNMPREELLEVVRQLTALNGEGIEVEAPPDLLYEEPFVPPPGIRTCAELWSRPFVNVDGTVKPCCYVCTVDELILGNIFEQSFDDIWFGEAYQELRRQHLAGDYNDRCAQCTQLNKVVEPVSGGSNGTARFCNVFLGRRRFSSGRGARNGLRGSVFANGQHAEAETQ